MELEERLQQALNKLAKGGKEIGQPTTLGGETVIPVNGVLLTPEKIFTAAEMDPHPRPKP
jgi:hypothetical protein